MSKTIGIVKWYNDAKGYGFLTCSATNREVFAHYSAIECEGFKTLSEGQTVQFDLIDGPKGAQAAHIEKVGA